MMTRFFRFLFMLLAVIVISFIIATIYGNGVVYRGVPMFWEPLRSLYPLATGSGPCGGTAYDLIYFNAFLWSCILLSSGLFIRKSVLKKRTPDNDQGCGKSRRWILYTMIAGILFLAAYSAWMSAFQFHEYLNVKNGNFVKEYALSSWVFYRSERESEISPEMRVYAGRLPETRLLIRENDGLLCCSLMTARCYAELCYLILEHRMKKTQVPLPEIMAIVDKYKKPSRNEK